MTVKEIFIPEYDIEVHGVGYEPAGSLHITGTNVKISLARGAEHEEEKAEYKKSSLKALSANNKELHDSLELLSYCATLCNNARLVQEKKLWKVLGDPTEGGLLTASEKMGFELTKLERQWKREREIPFDSERKMISVICSNKYQKKIYAFTKGAPDQVLDNCTHILVKGKIERLTEQHKKKIKQTKDKMATEALRVLGFAYKITSKQPRYTQKETEKGLIFIGLMGMIDPPRPEVIEAVKLTHQAGIRTYIITGDYGPTAEAIARQVGMIKTKKARIITGADLDKLSVPRLSKVIKQNPEIIFSRVSPQHKLQIVSVLKKHGEIVAMTGDGVNDAPALKRADIGVAMGIAGTDVSREASNMVLADYSYGTIVTAIEEGRKIYQNLKKFIFYIFSCNIGELVTVFAAIIFKMPAPLTAVLILCVDLGTDVLPALALGVDSADKDTMSTPPRNPKERILKLQFVKRFLYLGLLIGGVVTLYFYLMLRMNGYTDGNELVYLKASTSAFALLVFIQMWNALNSRSAKRSIFQLGLFSNMYLLGAIAISIITVFAFVEVPFVKELIGTTHLTATEWAIVIAVSSIVFIVEELRKLIMRPKTKSQTNG